MKLSSEEKKLVNFDRTLLDLQGKQLNQEIVVLEEQAKSLKCIGFFKKTDKDRRIVFEINLIYNAGDNRRGIFYCLWVPPLSVTHNLFHYHTHTHI